MMQRNSYLDSVNTGRRRRASTDFEAISATLSGLEAELDRLTRARAPQPGRMHRTAHRAHPHARPGSMADDAANTALLGKISREVESLRADMRATQPADFEQVIGQLREQLDALQNTVERSAPHDVSGEFNRLHDRLSSIPAATEHDQLSTMAAEINELKGMVTSLAREDSLRAVEERWNQFDARWDTLQDAVLNQTGQPQDVQNLADRIYNLQELVASLPQNLSFGALEQQVGVLAQAIERIAIKDGRDLGEAFSTIEERLDELSRAVVSSSVSETPPVTHDFSALDRIEARIAGIAKHIEEGGAQNDHAAMLARVEALADRIDSTIGDDADSGRLLEAFDERLQGLHRRLEDLAISMSDGGPGGASSDQLEQIELRMRELSDRFDRTSQIVPGADSQALINLQNQIADLSHHMSGLAAGASGGGAIEGRLAAIEQSLAHNQDNTFEVARAAAESALSAVQGSGDNTAVAALADDLKSLETLARSSDERHTQTFGTIHETLLRIVDRISTLELTGSAPSPTQATATPDPERERLSETAVPALDPTYDEPLPPLGEDSFGPINRDAPRSPAEAAAAAAKAAVDNDDSAPRNGMMGGLARALGRKPKDKAADDQPVGDPNFDAALEDFADAGDFDDALMEPGSGAPDLDAIMRRVRDDRKTDAPLADDNDNGRQDFLAAARRAAQAAAAEATIAGGAKDKGAKGTRRGKPNVAALAGKHKKPLMMAAYAVLLAIASWQLGKTFFTDAPKPVETAKPAKPIEQPVAQESAAVAANDTADAKPVRMVDAAAPDIDANVKAASIEGAAQDESVRQVEAQPAARAAIANAPAQPSGSAQEAATSNVARAPAPVFDAPPADAGPIGLREAAGNGDPAAMFEIAVRYGDGRNGSQDPASAYTWYKRSAETGFAPAQYRLGSLYEKGIGITRDIPQAKTWYQMAAAQGNASAMHNLAVLFAMGADGTPDHESAIGWFQRAAELGVKDSQYNLGILAANGQGMDQSLEESYKWFALAALAGDKEAAKRRDEVFKVLQPEQQERARATVKLWKPQPLVDSANTVVVPDEWREGNEQTASVDMKKAIQNIQGILNNNGYDAGPADGVMGARTKAAIKAFQTDSGLTPNGQIDDALVKALLAKN